MTLPEFAIPHSTPVVPLARARDGTPIPLPDGGFAWRVRRHTGGRPRLHLDGSKQPMQLSLSYSMADLDDILPPGSYKLDLVDRAGMPLGVTIDVEMGGLRNAAASESQDLEDGPISLSGGASDVRYLLEANVRSTQLAFQHNQRTLEAGLRMADTLREGIQSLAETQADWIKSFIGSRAFLRNSAAPPLAALPEPTRAEDEEEYEEEEEIPLTGTDRAMELGLAVVTLINNFMSQFKGSGSEPKQNAGKLDVRSLFDWQHAAEQGEAARSSDAVVENAPRPRTTAEVMASLPPALVSKVFAVRAQLSADEQSRLMQLLSVMPAEELVAIAASFDSMSTDEVLATVRSQIAVPVKGA
jgi:hypothetical protein